MKKTGQQKRAEKTREQIRAAARRLFLQHGFAGTSTDAIMEAAGISSTEPLYRHYPSKEDLFVDVLKHFTLQQPHTVEALSQVPVPHDLHALRQGLLTVAREILSIMIQPEYIALLRMVIAETARFPQIGSLFR